MSKSEKRRTALLLLGALVLVSALVGFLIEGRSRDLQQAFDVFEWGRPTRLQSGVLALKSGQKRCTAVQLGGGWILSAHHCASRFGSTACSIVGVNCFQVRLVDFHARFDVALYRAIAPRSADTQALEWRDAGSVKIGDELRLFGFGLRGGELPDATMPLRVVVKDERRGRFLVVPEGKKAPCLGDSGAPLFAAGQGKTAASLAAILVAGSASCQGPDVVVAIEELRPWLVRVIGASA